MRGGRGGGGDSGFRRIFLKINPSAFRWHGDIFVIPKRGGFCCLKRSSGHGDVPIFSCVCVFFFSPLPCEQQQCGSVYCNATAAAWSLVTFFFAVLCFIPSQLLSTLLIVYEYNASRHIGTISSTAIIFFSALSALFCLGFGRY